MASAMARSTVNEMEARKRVTKACDRCRLKKVKCDGNMPCPRCKAEDAVCQFGSRRKSTERAVSTGYVEQLELQQQILVKALKTVWKRYGPLDAQDTLGEDPSVHAIVQNLGELGAPASYQHLMTGFIFDGDLDKTRTSVTVEHASPSPTDARRTSDSSTNPTRDIDTQSTNSSNGRKSRPPSPTFSTSFKHGFHQEHPSVNTSQTYPTPPVEATSASSYSSRMNRPKFCPLPPRTNLPPVVPVPMEMYGDDAYNSSLQAPGIANDDGIWQITPAGWMNSCFDGDEAMGTDFDHHMEDLMAQNPDAWKSVMDESSKNEIVSFH